VHAHDTELLADAFKDPVVADQRTGVRHGRFGGDFAGAYLEHHQRFAQAHGTFGHAQKPLRVPESLGKHGD